MQAKHNFIQMLYREICNIDESAEWLLDNGVDNLPVPKEFAPRLQEEVHAT